MNEGITRLQSGRGFNSGIPVRLLLPNSVSVKSIYIDGRQTEWKTENERTKNIISILCTSSDSEIRIITDHEISRDFYPKIGLIGTEHNKDHVIYWENFIKDYLGFIPVRLNEINCNDDFSDFVLILAPDVVHLSKTFVKNIEAAVKNGTGLIITSRFPCSSLNAIDLEKDASFDSPGLFISRELTANRPFRKGDIIPIKYEIPHFKEVYGAEIISILSWNSWVGLLDKKIFRNLDAIFQSELSFNLINRYLILADKFKLLKKKPCAVSQKLGKGKIIRFSFDPVHILGTDSRIDEDVKRSAVHSNFLHLVLSSIIDVSKLILMKGLYKENRIPIIYSVDVEASVDYYDSIAGKCSSSGSKEPDTKMEFCLPNSARRLEEHNARGTFHVTTSGIYDKKDEAALKNVDSRHDISIHMGGDGNHSIWGENIRDPDYIFNNLSDGISILQKILNRKITGIRYPGWKRSEITHDIINRVGLMYDTSSYTHAPFASIPYRMYSYSDCRPLELWELPCREMINVVKGLPAGFKGKLGKLLVISNFNNYINQAYLHKGIIVFADHDMSIGTNPFHVHGTWQFDICSFRKIMRYCYQNKKFENLCITTGNEFITWYSQVRNILFNEFKILKKENGSEFIISIHRGS